MFYRRSERIWPAVNGKPASSVRNSKSFYESRSFEGREAVGAWAVPTANSQGAVLLTGQVVTELRGKNCVCWGVKEKRDEGEKLWQNETQREMQASNCTRCNVLSFAPVQQSMQWSVSLFCFYPNKFWASSSAWPTQCQNERCSGCSGRIWPCTVEQHQTLIKGWPDFPRSVSSESWVLVLVTRTCPRFHSYQNEGQCQSGVTCMPNWSHISL